MNFILSSKAFGDGEKIPQRYTAEGAEVSPPLSWSGAPVATREFALLCEDPDAPLPHSFVHWMVYGISANRFELPEGLSHYSKIGFPTNVRQGQNSKTKVGFTGPLPPFFHGYHRYFFRLFALNAPLHLAPGADREAFVAEMDGKVIGEARLIGLYARTPASRAKGVLKMATAIGAVAGLGIYLSRRIKESRSVRTSSGQNPTEIDTSDFATAAYVTEDLHDANLDRRARVKPAYRVDSDDQFHGRKE